MFYLKSHKPINLNNFVWLFLTDIIMFLASGKPGSLHVCKVSYQVILYSLYRLLRDGIFCLHWISLQKKLLFNSKSIKVEGVATDKPFQTAQVNLRWHFKDMQFICILYCIWIVYESCNECRVIIILQNYGWDRNFQILPLNSCDIDFWGTEMDVTQYMSYHKDNICT